MKQKIKYRFIKITNNICNKIHKKERWKMNFKRKEGITLIALVITIVLNSSYLAMERMNKIEKI